jgi:hypothetical protein
MDARQRAEEGDAQEHGGEEVEHFDEVVVISVGDFGRAIYT